MDVALDADVLVAGALVLVDDLEARADREGGDTTSKPHYAAIRTSAARSFFRYPPKPAITSMDDATSISSIFNLCS